MMDLDKDFWLEMAPYLYPADLQQNSFHQVDQIIKFTGIHPSAAILDAACGPGRHSFEFARRKFRVTAYDLQQDILAQNQKNSIKEGLDIEWLQANMLDFSRPEGFDLILNLYYSFGFFENPSHDEHALQNFYNSLKGGGKLLMELNGRDLIEKWFYPKYWGHEPDGAFVLNEREMNWENGWLLDHFYILKEGSVQKYSLGTRLYYAVQITELLQKVGFKQVQVFGGFDQKPYDEKAACLLILAQKPLSIDRMIRC